MDGVAGQGEAFVGAQIDEAELAGVDVPAVLDEAGFDLGVVETDDLAGLVVGEQEPALLEALAHRRHPVGQAATLETERHGRDRIAESGAVRVDVVVIVVVDRAAGKTNAPRRTRWPGCGAP